MQTVPGGQRKGRQGRGCVCFSCFLCLRFFRDTVGLPARCLLTIYAQTKMCWIGHLKNKEAAHPCPRCSLAALPIAFCVGRMVHHSHPPPTTILSSQYLTHPQAHKIKHTTRYICEVTASDFCVHSGPKNHQSRAD